MILALLKTLVTLIIDIVVSILYKKNTTNIPFEETMSKLGILYRSVIWTTGLIVLLLWVSSYRAGKMQLEEKNNIIHKQVAIIRECRPDYRIEKSLDFK